MKNPTSTTRRRTRSETRRAPDHVPERSDAGRPSTIAELAYRLYEERGREDGHQLEDWVEAERRLSAKHGAGDTAGPGSTTATETEKRDDRQGRKTADKQAR